MSSGIDFRDRVVVLGEREEKKEIVRVCALCHAPAIGDFGDIPVCDEHLRDVAMVVLIFLALMGSGYLPGSPDVPFVPTANPRMNLSAFL